MWEINPSGGLKEEINGFLKSLEGDPDYYRFAEELIWGGVKRRDEIDAVIKEHAQNWDFNRIAKIDLSILRLAIYEMLYRDDIPPIVTINEAIELSKLFSIEDAKRFINGILDEFKLKLQRPLREATR
jgi:N utilization substance protein B